MAEQLSTADARPIEAASKAVISGAAADLDQDFLHHARGFGADLRLVRRRKGPGQIDLTLDGHAMDGGRTDGNGRPADDGWE